MAAGGPEVWAGQARKQDEVFSREQSDIYPRLPWNLILYTFSLHLTFIVVEPLSLVPVGPELCSEDNNVFPAGRGNKIMVFQLGKGRETGKNMQASELAAQCCHTQSRCFFASILEIPCSSFKGDLLMTEHVSGLSQLC